MTMKKRLSMTGLIEEFVESVEDKDSIAQSGHTCDQTASDDGSQSSVILAETSEPKKPASSIRRRSLFGNTVDHPAPIDLQLDNTTTPTSRRRRSFFGSSSSHQDDDDDDETEDPKKPSSLRRGFFASSTKTPAATEGHDDFPSERSESTCSSRPPPAARRRSLLGSSHPSLEETIGGTPPRPSKDSSSQSVASESSNSVTRRSYHSAETPPLDKKRGVHRAKSMESPAKKDKRKVMIGANRSFYSGDAKMRGRKGEHSSEVENELLSPMTPKTPRSFRRLSLGALLGGNSSTSDAQEGLVQPKASQRRRSLTGGIDSPSTTSSGTAEKSPAKPPRRCSTGGIGGVNTSSTNPFDLVNKARTKRGLHEYSRNLLMDTLAKQVALDLAASDGNRCTPTSYHGNVGQGESVESIHETMMRQKGRTARTNLLAPHFFEIGIGMARGTLDRVGSVLKAGDESVLHCGFRAIRYSQQTNNNNNTSGATPRKSTRKSVGYDSRC